jgi:hypothetical protein
MAATELEILEETEEERIRSWRRGELMRAGYARSEASRIARRHDVDLHQAVRLLEQGCPPELALRILL